MIIYTHTNATLNTTMQLEFTFVLFSVPILFKCVLSNTINFVLLLDDANQEEDVLQAMSAVIDGINEHWNSTLEVGFSTVETKVTCKRAHIAFVAKINFVLAFAALV